MANGIQKGLNMVFAQTKAIQRHNTKTRDPNGAKASLLKELITTNAHGMGDIAH